MTRKHVFRPGLNDVQLEERVALSQLGTVQVAAVQAKPTGTPVLKHQTLNDVNRSIDNAFNRFNKDYAGEFSALKRTGNSTQFQAKFEARFPGDDSLSLVGGRKRRNGNQPLRKSSPPAMGRSAAGS